MTSGAVGLVIARPARMLGIEAFMMELVAGLEETLAPRDVSVLLHVVPDHEAELAAWQRWADGRMVDGLVVVDLFGRDDPRLAALVRLGLPAVLLGGPRTGLPIFSLYVDDAGGMDQALATLAGLGHRRIARVSGPAQLLHTQVRTAAFLAGCERRGVTARVVEGTYDEKSGVARTRELLGSPHPPTAIVYDNDVMAAAGLAVAAEHGLVVPDQLSIVAWDDSPLCRLATPSLTVVANDVHQLGELVAGLVVEALAGASPRTQTAPPPQLLLRGSTAAPVAAPARKVH